MNIIGNVFFYIVIIIFSIGVLVNVIAPKGIVDSYIRWGLPGWFRFITACLEALALVLIFIGFDVSGYVVALAVMGVAIVILGINKEYKPIIAPLITSAMIIFLLQ